MEEFKIFQCTNKECLLNVKFTCQPLRSYFKCQFYHKDEDRRRKELTYQPIYLFDANNQKNPYCNNIFEYLYHPKVYKTLKCCFINEKNECNLENCPFDHDQRLKTMPQIEIQIPIQSIASEMPDIKIQLKKKRIIKQEEKIPHRISIKGQIEKQTRYYYNQQVQFYEDKTHEFKLVRKLSLEMVNRYICAFLNSSGGTLYMGIRDDGIVKGIHLTQNDMDCFNYELSVSLSRFDPCVLNDQIVLTYHQVHSNQDLKRVNENYYVVEIYVKQTTSISELYFTDQKEAYIKKAASINQLQPKEIKAYVKQRAQFQMKMDHEFEKK